jgi:hypothetical protein
MGMFPFPQEVISNDFICLFFAPMDTIGKLVILDVTLIFDFYFQK